MIDDSPAQMIPLHQPRRPKTPAERQRAYRERKRQQRQIASTPAPPLVPAEVLPNDLPDTPAVGLSVTANVAPAVVLPAGNVTPVTPAVALPVTANVTPVARADALTVTPVMASHRHVTGGRPISSYALTAAALALASVGLAMNGWFARSLGSSDFAGWLFLALGVAVDLVTLTLPSAAAWLWQTRRRVSATAAWLVWLLTSAFAFTAGIGFASLNAADVTLARASRVTPAVTIAQDALRDAMTSRNRECVGGVGRFCREREQAVTDRRRALDIALNSVEHAADPQTEAAIKVVAWATFGTVKLTTDDFAVMRLALVALLPQVGGMLLMIGLAACEPPNKIHDGSLPSGPQSNSSTRGAYCARRRLGQGK